jgi:predicted nicotinamide N-methyase
VLFVLCAGDGAATVVALQQGAGRVVANDILPLALESTRLNIQENKGVGGEEEEEEERRVNYISDDIVGTDVHGLFAMGGGGGNREGVDVVVAGDVLYDDDLAKAVFPWFVELASSGVEVLVGDPGRWVLQGNVVEKEGVVVVGGGTHVCWSRLLFTFVVWFGLLFGLSFGWLLVGYLKRASTTI